MNFSRSPEYTQNYFDDVSEIAGLAKPPQKANLTVMCRCLFGTPHVHLTDHTSLHLKYRSKIQISEMMFKSVKVELIPFMRILLLFSVC